MKKLLCIALSLLILALCFCGCSKEDTPSPYLIIISGYNANAPTPNFNSSEIASAIYNCCYGYGVSSVIVADGEPYLAGQWEINFQNHSVSESTRKRTANAQRDVILTTLINSKAKTPEVDLLEALTLAGRIFSGANPGSEKTLLIYSSCLSTIGYVDFANDNLLCAEPEAVIEYLRSNDALPDLSGVSVRIASIGDVAEPQDELTPSNRKKLKAIWSTVLMEAGASEIEFLDSVLPSGVVDDSLPEVSTVPIVRSKDDDIDFKDLNILDECSLGFKPDSTEFLDESAALEFLFPYAEKLKQQPETTVIVCGRTASVLSSSDRCVSFSLKRAETVKNGLIALGVDERQLLTIGLGFDNKYTIPDIEDGKLNQNAQANRCVMLIDANTDEGKFILAHYD